jgi:hypothetical protein
MIAIEEETSHNEVNLEIKVPRLPHMSSEAVAYLGSQLEKANCFLEYGSGGSTRLATRLKVESVYSVESDAAFGKAVRRYVSREAKGSQLKMIQPDIGEVGQWGYPVGSASARQWKSYPLDVWNSVEAAGKSPDIILVDGRFRVACCLVSFLKAKPGTPILFDDYLGREDRYQVVEKHSSPIQAYGKSLLFHAPSRINARSIAIDLLNYMSDPR